MPEVFRKHYSYGETIPILDTFVGMTADLFEITEAPSAGAPVIKAVLTALAGPMKSSPMIVEPVHDNDSKVVSLTDIPVPIPSVRTVDISLIFDLVNYRWVQSQELPQNNGVVTFDLRLRAAFSLLGKSYTLQLDQRPCAITLRKWQLPIRQYAGTLGFDSNASSGQQPGAQGVSDGERATANYEYASERRSGQAIGGNIDPPGSFTNQLDMEERLRVLSTKLLIRT